MFMADYHTHSHHSPDGAEPVEALARAAEAAGLSELAVTDHCDVGPFEHHEFDGAARRLELREVRERFGGRLSLLYAVELGEPLQDPEKAGSVLRENSCDFVIGSCHVLSSGEDFYKTLFPDIACCMDALSRYLDEALEMARTQDFDVFGHLTYPLRYMNGRDHMGVSLAPLDEKVEALFRALIDSGKGIELNVSGLGTAWGRPMPELEYLKLYRACGGEIITVGTDAHAARRVGLGLSAGYELLRQAGFAYVTAFFERKPRYERIL